MRRSWIFLAAGILAVAACRDGTGTLGPSVSSRLAPDGPTKWVDGRYPTEEEYYAELGNVQGDITGYMISASFVPGAGMWSTTADVTYQYGNFETAKLTAAVRYRDGSDINTDEDTHLYDEFFPRREKYTAKLALQLSTNNHTCDIVGKARIQATSATKVFRLGILTVYTQAIDTQYPDKALPPCNADGCDDPSTPAIEDCGEGEREEPYDSGEPGGGGGGGDCPTCIEQPPEYTTCWVKYFYNRKTLEVISAYLLYCT